MTLFNFYTGVLEQIVTINDGDLVLVNLQKKLSYTYFDGEALSSVTGQFQLKNTSLAYWLRLWL